MGTCASSHERFAHRPCGCSSHSLLGGMHREFWRIAGVQVLAIFLPEGDVGRRRGWSQPGTSRVLRSKHRLVLLSSMALVFCHRQLGASQCWPMLHTFWTCFFVVG